jgi:tryptophan 2-monooxygenase
MSLHKSVDISYQPPQEGSADEWRFTWPNTSDFNFNYYRLLNTSDGTNFAQRKQGQAMKIAVVGAGVAGLTAARELFRSGYTDIHIYEASDRIGGRTWSIKADGQDTAFEMGAMRMPFFSAPGSKNSVLDFYRGQFGIATQPFPNPGSNVVKTTGIYLNEGYGPNPDPANPPEPQMLLWEGGGEPPSAALQEVYKIWTDFATKLVTPVLQQEYGKSPAEWTAFWQEMVKHYWNKNFREFTYMPRIDKYDPSKPGFFGGLGMTQKQSALFYTIGAGDGSWGAFYDISCLYVIRTLLFGFGTNHQLIKGLFGPDGKFKGGPEHDGRPRDSHGRPLAAPQYIGVQSFAECMFYMPVKSANETNGISLYQAMHRDFGVRLWTGTSVKRMVKRSDGRILIASRHTGANADEEAVYDAVIQTAPTWAIEMSMGTDFPLTQVPLEVTQSLRNSHWISSCKVFFPLKERYWETTKIPQLIATDTYLQGVYAYAVDSANRNPGVLLASYTWEDGANKFLPEMDKKELARLCLQKLDEVLMRCKNIGQPVSRFVDTSKEPMVIQWSEQKTYRGCAKLYRETSWPEDYVLLTYNQKFSAKSQLYFAGEGFSVQGGWTEPALRGALDAVVYLVQNNGGEFRGGFRFADYPKYEYADPTNPYPCATDRLSLFSA